MLALLFFAMTAWSLWHMAGLYDRINTLEEKATRIENGQNN